MIFFYEKEEAYSCGHSYDEDTKLKSGDEQLRPEIYIAGICNCAIRFMTGISDNKQPVYEISLRTKLHVASFEVFAVVF